MPLQNRVGPWGRLERDRGRGTLTGNRGILHDDGQQIVRSHTTKAWIACELSWRGRRRSVMTGRTWTELFFLDEATALAAGHRPCGYCRRGDYLAFVEIWSAANPRLAPTTGRRAPVVDAALHRERRRADGVKRTWTADREAIPAGAMFTDGTTAFLAVSATLALPWSFEGYGRVTSTPSGAVEVLTPPSTVAALAAGYVPRLHLTAAIAARSLDDHADGS